MWLNWTEKQVEEEEWGKREWEPGCGVDRVPDSGRRDSEACYEDLAAGGIEQISESHLITLTSG